ncbi:MAG: energy-coupled thiamine transporter ThiT [Clostridiales bacterium]|nr:energy-coupled thiamine transporter ThiT [Clostridiales bacterium]
MASTKTSSSRIRVLVECAIMVALAVVIDLIPMPKWPNGGSVSIKVIPLIFISYRHGIKWGLGSSFVFSILTMLFGVSEPPVTSFFYYLVMILLDYVIAYTVMGLADLFAKPWQNKLVGYGVGAVCVNLLRFLCSFLSGWVIWGVYAPEGQPAWLYSLTYNGGYMLPNAVLCAIVIVLLCALVNPKTLKPMKK